MISIVIPAYNEASVIERCLHAITGDAQPGELEIIVACNGCRDDTAQRARSFGDPVRVVETQTASKVAALNLGDQAATAFPRFYIDADVQINLDAIRRVAHLLEIGPALAAAPAMRVDLSASSTLVRMWYAIWRHQPYHGPGMIGAGVYAMSRQGRVRFGDFPPIIADDEFARAHFAPHERDTPDDCHFTIRAPAKLKDLVKIKTRSRLGLYQLRQQFPDLESASTHKSGSLWRNVLMRPALWGAVPVYVLVNFITRWRATCQLRQIEHYRWERDETSRPSSTIDP